MPEDGLDKKDLSVFDTFTQYRGFVDWDKKLLSHYKITAGKDRDRAKRNVTLSVLEKLYHQTNDPIRQSQITDAASRVESTYRDKIFEKPYLSH